MWQWLEVVCGLFSKVSFLWRGPRPNQSSPCQDAGSQQIGFLLGSCGVCYALTSEGCYKGLPKTATGEIHTFKGARGSGDFATGAHRGLSGGCPDARRCASGVKKKKKIEVCSFETLSSCSFISSKREALRPVHTIAFAYNRVLAISCDNTPACWCLL